MQLPENLINAINKYLAGTATAEEKEQVDLWYRSFNDENVEVPSYSVDMKDQINTRLKLRLKEIMDKSDDEEIQINTPRRTMLMRIAAAAVLVFIVSTGTYFFLNRSDDTQLVKKANPVKDDIRRYENKAVLTLQDGSKISLTDLAKGKLIRQNGFSITKIAEGQLIYNLTSTSNANADVTFNTIETPKGGQYQVEFPDGSKVWLNAASSFQFPILFSEDEFNTNLNGEAYFEVASDKLRKFRVKSGKQSVEVLGTRFNINAYRDEPSVNTTLFEGSILITDLRNHNSRFLKPGQQATLNETLNISDADVQNAVSWTEGYFHFNDADIKTVMRQLEKWYGISTRYEGVLPSQKFAGSIDRKLTLEQVLGILGKSQVHFKVKGKEVVVMP